MECDGCTLCCELLDVPWMNSPAGHICKHCEVGKGCRIFSKAPSGCTEFRCAYNQMKKASLKLRPDKCGVVFFKVSNKLFIASIDPKLSKIPKIVIKQMETFKKDGFSTIMFNRMIKQPFIFNTEDRPKESVWFEYKIIKENNTE